MAIITTIAQIQEQVDTRIQANIHQLTPEEPIVLQKYVYRFIPEPVINHWQTGELTPAEETMLKKLTAALANFIVAEYIPKSEVSVTTTGVTRTEGENDKTAYKYQTAALQRKCLANAWHHLDSLLASMRNYDLEVWFESPLRLRLKERFIRSGADLAQYINVGHPELTFAQLLPIIDEVEELVMMKIFGESFIVGRGIARDYDVADEPKRRLFHLFARIIANAAILRAIPRMVVRIDNGQLTAIATDMSYADNGSGSANGQNISFLLGSIESTYNAYVKEALKHLDENADTFSWTKKNNPRDINRSLNGSISL